MSRARISQEGVSLGLAAEDIANVLGIIDENREEMRKSGSRKVLSVIDKENLENPMVDNSPVLKKSKEVLTTEEEAVNHHPQMIDEDVETFTNRLDTLIMTFRTESLKEFRRIKRNVLAEQAQRIDSEKTRCSALLTTKQDELERTKDALVTASAQARRSAAQIERFGAHLRKFNKKATVRLHKMLAALREAVRRKRRNRRIVEMRLVQHNRVVKLTAFGGLKRNYAEYKRRKNREQEEQRVKVVWTLTVGRGIEG
eukprot:TRINITY_DN7500_c0_g1_i6.p1 TRINITY_DN7500_c0_g1~~TRINITY_DN7500_c0_g1_i6.p1  ORF type:complete len:293 (-),score=69.32 TRINITY_DN7500_c0_g1_i6:851-1618(-)